MAEWWMDDDAVNNHYRDRWELMHGYDPLDLECELISDADYEEEIAREKYDRRDR